MRIEVGNKVRQKSDPDTVLTVQEVEGGILQFKETQSWWIADDFEVVKDAQPCVLK